MSKYIFQRLLLAILAVFIVITLVFFLSSLIPGYPIEKTQHQSNEEFERTLQNFGLLDSPFKQYVNFWKNLITTGQFGLYFKNTSINIVSRFAERLPYTFIISGISFLLGALIGIVLGVISAVYRSKWQDVLINIISIIFTSIPSFVLASFVVRWASSGGWPIAFPAIDSAVFTPRLLFQTALLPIFILTFLIIPAFILLTRNEMVDVLKQDYIKTALAKGLSFKTVLFKHAIRNASVPILDTFIPSLMFVISGSFIIERFFGVPGMATEFVEAVQGKEIYILVFQALFISGGYFILEIIKDWIITLVDPRIRLAKSNNVSIFVKIKNWIQNLQYQNKVFKFNNNNTCLEIEENSLFYDYVLDEKLIHKNKIKINKNIVNQFGLKKQYTNVLFKNNFYKIIYSEK